tara:strand:+ start:287 stop:919 length:633 start_codon:yes stop_codon:yes gene_type:complete
MSTLEDRIEAISKSPYLSDWEQGFCESIFNSLKKWGNLTPKQHNLLQKIEGKYTPEKIKEIEGWKQNFTAEMRHRLKIAANYYANHAGYYVGIARAALYDETYVPTRDEYKKMCENKYAQGVIENALSEPKYPVGSFVMARSNHPNRWKVKDKLLLIIEHSEDIKSHAKGAKAVSVLPVGDSEVIWTEERYLKLPAKRGKKVDRQATETV